MSEVIWSGKPNMWKTSAKMLAVFILLSLVFSPLLFFPSLYFVGAVLTLLISVAYYFSKKAFTYYITSNSVRISKSWVFGNYDRVITLDKIQDVYVKQGIIARRFKCGSLVFVTTTGLEVGYTIAGGGAEEEGVGAGGGFATPQVVESKGNTFSDIQDPASAREIMMNKLTDWRNAFQQQKIAASTQKMATSLERIEERSTVQPSQTRFCHMCGAGNTSESRFCHKCGSKLLTE
jgi:membrane protein YdbS with pleckstrin-like domain/ribosomal protein L40E